MTKEQKALFRAVTGAPCANDVRAILEFEQRGIFDAEPRINVFTYAAWKAKGRQVMKGEKGVKLTTWIKKDEHSKAFCRAVSVFHISQTQEA